MFKDFVRLYITESERSDKVADKSSSARVTQLMNYFRDDKEVSSYLKDLRAKLKKRTGSADIVFKEELAALEKSNPKLFNKLADNLGDVKITLGKHTPLDDEKAKKIDKKRRYEEMEDSGLKGKERDKSIKQAAVEDKKLREKDKKAAEQWEEGKEIKTSDDEDRLAFDKFKTKNKNEKVMKDKFKEDVLKYSKMKK